MTFTKLPRSSTAEPQPASWSPPRRPRFDSNNTTDRLREGLPSFSRNTITKGRRSIFQETGLSEHESAAHIGAKEFGQITGLNSDPSPADGRPSDRAETLKTKTRWISRLTALRPRVKSPASASPPPPAMSSLARVSMLALFIAVVLPAISYRNGHNKVEMSGADAGVIRDGPSIVLNSRADSPVDVCLRWAHQSAMVNGTVYVYGGQTKDKGDKSGTWNNNLLILDTTKSWDISSPALSGLPRPSGPPEVSLGYLWHDYNNLYLYGGQFGEKPFVEPGPNSVWQYDIPAKSWNEFKNPQTSAGNFSSPEGLPVQRSAEGAGISVPELGLSWYFGGHLDMHTTPGWSNQIARIYLKSLLEFTHPGYNNLGVDSLHSTGAGNEGAYRNITEGGIQDESGFSERADGVLVFVPGWGPRGILLGLGGGTVTNQDTEADFSSMSTIDVYDIESSTWYHQETTGKAPGVRVNPCAVVFSASDASSFNIYLYGGQNLLPVAGQTQYTDMWILTVPSFTWIKVDVDANGEPPARAGHTCHARDGQMLVVGGYIGQNDNCEKSGVFNFDASTLRWRDKFEAADHPADIHPENNILADSYGYKVPEAVQRVVGGDADGGATATQPASGPATNGPFKTGRPPVFTVTASGSAATSTSGGGGSGGAPSSGDSNGGLIAAGVIAGVLGVLAAYLGFCAWLYRRQVRAYKKHMAMANRYGGPDADTAGGMAAAGGGGLREKWRRQRQANTAAEGEQFGWVGQQLLSEPKVSSDPSSSASTSNAPNHAPRLWPGEDRGHPATGGSGSTSTNPWGYYNDTTPSSRDSAAAGPQRHKSSATRSTASDRSADGLLDGREPNFFSVVLGPRRALRVVNGMEDP